MIINPLLFHSKIIRMIDTSGIITSYEVKKQSTCRNSATKLRAKEKKSNNLTSFWRSLKLPILHAVCKEIKVLMELLNDYHEAVCLMKFTEGIHTIKLELR
jgi:hypothetical protein